MTQQIGWYSMARTKSAQSLALRRRYTINFLLAILAYTFAFCLAMVVLNKTLVPQIADYIFDATSESIYVDPANYLEENSVAELLEDQLDAYESEDASYEVLWINPEYQGVLEDNGIAPSSTEGGGSSSEFAKADYPNNLIGEIRLDRETRLPVLDKESSANETTVVRLTPLYLAYSKAVRDAYESEAAGGVWRWERASTEADSDTTFPPFILRNMTVYETAKTLKIPVAILLYLLGCLIISLAEMRKALGYFDELSSAIVSLVSHKEQPIVLSKDLSIAQDEVNRIREEAVASDKAAEAAQQRNHELVAYLAHDIRTPLTSVIGFLSMLDEDERLPDDLRRYTSLASQKADGLQALINELFDITRFNAQSISIERAPIGVMFLLQQLANEFYPQAQSRQNRIEVRAPEHERFSVDGEKLARALGNVLRNALTYAKRGTEITIEANRTGPQWTIVISNQGSDIPVEHLERIFEKFYRDDTARNSDAGGAGLGLAIAKEIVLAHDGSIGVTSEHGVTSFIVTLPSSLDLSE